MANDEPGMRGFVDALAAVAWIADDRGSAMHVNDAWRSLFGADPYPGNAAVYDYLHPDDRGGVRELRERAFRDGLPTSYDARVRVKDGSYVPLRVSLYPIVGPHGRNWMGVAFDLHELDAAAGSGELYRSRYNQLIDHSLVGVVTARYSDGTILDANDAFLSMIGYSRDELAAGDLTRIVLTPHEWLGDSEAASKELAERGVISPFEKEYIHKNGSRVPVLITGVRRAGTDDQALCFIVDLSERKQMLRQLQASEERYESLLEIVPVMISMDGPAGWWANANWKRYTGLSGKLSVDERLAVVHPDDRRAASGALARDAGEIEIRLRRYDGDYRWHFMRWSLQRNAADGTQLRIATAVDVHDARMLRDRRNAEMLRIADALPQLVWSTSGDGSNDYVNGAWATYAGGQIGSEGPAWARIIHPADRERARQRWDRCLETGETFEVEFRLRRHDGEYRWFLARALPLADETPRTARWFGTCTDIEDQKRALDAAALGERRYRDLAEAMPQIVWTTDCDGKVNYINGRWVDFTGRTIEEAFGEGYLSAVPPEDRQSVHDQLMRLIASGAPFTMENRLWHVSGRYRWIEVRARPQVGPEGNIERWIGTCTDVDNERRVAEEQAYLAEVSRLLASTLEIETTLSQVAALAVPVLGDWCEIDLLQEDGTFKTAAIAHYDAFKHRSLQALIGRVTTSSSNRLEAAVQSGKTAVYAGVSDEDMQSSGVPSEHLEVYRETGMASVMLTPLIAGSEPLGVIAYVISDASRTFTDADRRFGEELARRAALSIQNAQLYAREHRVADAMQSASLPKDLPEVPALEMSAIYVPGNSEAQIGGDWFDAFRLRDGRLVLSIGDVAGSGLDAAVTMSNMRQIIRGTAQVHADPVLMLNAADRALRLEEPDRFVTAFVGVLDPITRMLTYASAGHHPPYVRYENGRLEELRFSDLPLGLRHRSTASPQAFEVPANAILVMYTDGLIESHRDLEGGVAALEAVLSNSDFGRIDYPAEYLREQLLSEGTRDDVAILTLRFLPDELVDPLVYRWRYTSLDAQSLHEVRSRMREALHGRDFTVQQVEVAQVVLGELAGNVIRHAPGPLEIVLDFTGPAPVLHVIDEGPGFERAPMLPADEFSETGRGLFIVSELAELLSVSRRPTGGSHARAVLVGGR